MIVIREYVLHLYNLFGKINYYTLTPHIVLFAHDL
jgi:hypothetical protein